jgi:deoxyribose-phosphate aldolase
MKPFGERDAMAGRVRAHPAGRGQLPHTLQQFMELVDHTLIRPEMTRAEVDRGIELALALRTAAVVVRPWEVRSAKDKIADSNVRLVTSIAFPHGAEPTDVKVFQAEHAASDGADEIDVVMNVGAFRSGDLDYVLKDLSSVVGAVSPPILVKVLIESAYLDPSQVVDAAGIAVDAGAAFVKNGTGFSPRGAVPLEIALIRATVGNSIGVKAAGGIRDLDTAMTLIQAGANRLGTSSTQTIADQWRAVSPA